MSLFDFFHPASPDSGRTKKSTLQFRGLEVVVIRRPHRRSMTVAMRPNEPLKVTTALRVTDAQILGFLETKAAWVDRNLAQFAKMPARPERIGKPGETWLFRGRDLVLTDAITLLGKPFVVWGQEDVCVYWPEHLWSLRHEKREQALAWIEKSLRFEAEKLLTERVDVYSRQMQLFPRKLRFMRARTRWGSCSSRGSLNLNWKLISAPLHVIDSVVVHELAHLQHMNHSNAFWSLVEKFSPDHREADRWLKDFQHLI